MLGPTLSRLNLGRRLAPATLAFALLLSACAPQRSEPAKLAAPAPAAAPGAAPAAPAAQPAVGAPGAMTVKFSHVVAKDTPKGKAADKFAELVKQKSGGKI